MVDTTDSKSVVARRKSSSLFSGIKSFPVMESFFVLTLQFRNHVAAKFSVGYGFGHMRRKYVFAAFYVGYGSGNFQAG